MRSSRTPDHRGGLRPDSTAAWLVIDLLRLAEEEIALPDLLTQAGERLYTDLAPYCLAALVVPSAIACPSATPLTSFEFASALEQVLPHVEIAVYFDQEGGRRVAGNELLSVGSTGEAAGSWLWSVIDAGDRRIVWAFYFPPLQPDQVRWFQDLIQGLMVMVIGRYRVARQVQQRLDRAATLYTMLEDITSHLDVDHVLTTIVAQARTLLESDSAYLAEVDPANQTVKMRVTVGIADEAYRHASIELGKGLAGVVAASGRVMHSRDYLADPRFLHTPETDANMRREGMRSALAAPLQVGSRVLGVLAVTNHRPTDFSADDVSLIKSLADGAAIAVNNAHLYAEQEQLVSQLQELNALTTSQHDALKRAVFIHDQLTELALRGHGISTIAERLSGLIDNPTLVLGRHFTVLAAAGLAANAAADAAAPLLPIRRTPLIAAALARLGAGRRPIHLARDAELGLAESRILAPVISGEELLGYVMVIESLRPFGELDFQALEHASTVFALEMTHERAIAEVEQRLRGDFVHDLVSGNYQPDIIVRRAARLGHDLALPQVLLAVALDPTTEAESAPTDAQMVEWCRQLERTVLRHFQQQAAMAQTSVIGDVVIALLALMDHRGPHGGTPLAILRDLQREVTLSLKPRTASIGVSRVARTPSDLAQGYREALQALKTSQHFGARGALIEFEQLGIERILAQVPDPGELARYVDHKLGALLAYDSQQGTTLVETLEAYLDCGCRQRDAAQRLGIHVNSLCYRLGRIEHVCGARLDEVDNRLDLHFALRMRRMLSTGGSVQWRATPSDIHPPIMSSGCGSATTNPRAFHGFAT